MEPFIDPRSTGMPEFTWRAVIVGTLLGIVFGASSLYLVLKVGLTVSASIPVAVISLSIFRALSRTFGSCATPRSWSTTSPKPPGRRVSRLLSASA